MLLFLRCVCQLYWCFLRRCTIRAVPKSVWMSYKWLLMARYYGLSRFLAMGSSMKLAMRAKKIAAMMNEIASLLRFSPTIELNLRFKQCGFSFLSFPVTLFTAYSITSFFETSSPFQNLFPDFTALTFESDVLTFESDVFTYESELPD